MTYFSQDKYRDNKLPVPTIVEVRRKNVGQFDAVFIESNGETTHNVISTLTLGDIASDPLYEIKRLDGWE
tara:strand:- start:434 stop:643 length:210 start_codon:yes stop_codon:yes gene_type:complete